MRQLGSEFTALGLCENSVSLRLTVFWGNFHHRGTEIAQRHGEKPSLGRTHGVKNGLETFSRGLFAGLHHRI